MTEVSKVNYKKMFDRNFVFSGFPLKKPPPTHFPYGRRSHPITERQPKLYIPPTKKTAEYLPPTTPMTGHFVTERGPLSIPIPVKQLNLLVPPSQITPPTHNSKK